MTINNKKKKEKGGTAILIILVLGLVVVEIATASLLSAYLVGQQGIGTKRAQEVEAAAFSGIDDALLKIARDKSFTPVPNPYTLNVGNIAVSILVCRELTAASSTSSCTTPALTEKYQILSTATFVGQKSSLRATVGFSDITGRSAVETIEKVHTGQ